MKVRAPGSFGAQLKALREAAGFTQEELATIAGLSVHAGSALERRERRRPHVATVLAVSGRLAWRSSLDAGSLSKVRLARCSSRWRQFGIPRLLRPRSPSRSDYPTC